MNGESMEVCAMEQEIMTIRGKYKPYFDLERENRKLKNEVVTILHTIEKVLLLLMGMISADLINKIFF